jgi:COX assembly protein 1
VIKDFADCARGRTISVAWHCKEQHLAMNSCMMQYATKTEEDAAREEWFEGIMARRRKKEEELVKVEERRAEVIDLTRRQEEKERVEMERKKLEMEEAKRAEGKEKKGGSWWR